MFRRSALQSSCQQRESLRHRQLQPVQRLSRHRRLNHELYDGESACPDRDYTCILNKKKKNYSRKTKKIKFFTKWRKSTFVRAEKFNSVSSFAAVITKITMAFRTDHMRTTAVPRNENLRKRKKLTSFFVRSNLRTLHRGHC